MKIKDTIADTAQKLANNYKEQGLFDISLGEKLPNRDEIISVINEVRKLFFPGFFGDENMAYADYESFAGYTTAVVSEKLFRQINISLALASKGDKNETKKKAMELTRAFIEKIPEMQALIMKDVDAFLEGDPAAFSKEEIIFCYPGMYAISVYRMAHVLYELKVPYVPRIMSEHAHGKTGIDINPGAVIGEYFFIDHGTGIVIGETTEIGDRVKIYQGVTLGALSTRQGQALSGKKRHPTIEDNVVIYANTTVLGGKTVIGKNSVIAGNTFVIESVPENSRVLREQ